MFFAGDLSVPLLIAAMAAPLIMAWIMAAYPVLGTGIIGLALFYFGGATAVFSAGTMLVPAAIMAVGGLLMVALASSLWAHLRAVRASQN